MDQRAESQSGPPGLAEIVDIHLVVTCRVLLAPGQQLLNTAG